MDNRDIRETVNTSNGLFSRIRDHETDVSKLLFLIAGLYGVVSVSMHPPQWGAPVEMVQLADNIAATGNFANPFWILNTGPTAVSPPLYPFFLALLIKVLRNTTLVYTTAVIGVILANAITAVLLPKLSRMFYGDMIPGIIASILWIAAMPLWPTWDASYTVAGILAFCLITSGAPGKGERTIGRAAIGGVIAGLVCLLNPSTLLITIPWIVFVSWKAEGSTSRRLQYCCTILIVVALFLGAWGARNYRVLGGFVVRTNLGMTLYASNNDCAEASMFRNQLSGCFALHHPNENLSEASLLMSLGEIRYDRQKIADTARWIRNNPQRFSALTGQRFVSFWFPPVERLPSQLELEKKGYSGPNPVAGWIAYRNRAAWVIRIVTCLSIPGLVLMLLRREAVVLYVLAALGIYPLLYYVVVADQRYRVPVLWLSLLPAGYFVYYLIELTQPLCARADSR